MQPVTINNTSSDEMVEIPIAEYEAIKAVAVGIAEQNVKTQEAIGALAAQSAILTEAIKTMSAVLAAATAENKGLIEAMQEAIANIKVEVNLPEQPAPIVNFNPNIQLPEQPAPTVTFNPPAEKKKVTVIRNKRTGLSDGYLIE